jgi:hypothetical protein
MLLKKEQGGCVVAGYTWEHDGDVVEVPDALGNELLAIPGGDFVHVPEDAAEADTDPAPGDGEADADEDDGSEPRDGDEDTAPDSSLRADLAAAVEESGLVDTLNSPAGRNK